ncbi:hypothetical protein pneo_cds_159 [Pandoravirus neocaledonia]|uniref:Uncharacterized protein n=1 Tax=Pandoravirus neocaledonia TaxID=2107708 RepID=A0A2U7UBF5_9VIRU|nr:hypothetical protein pneo_cds_159 [Pandoravirus neocaledonia]AVK75766.1 hypothetical protein pneo_cds_159 [Pandoravirus neocaledonia]
MDGTVVASHGARAARDVLTLWRGCYEDARLIDTPWADGDRALAIVHALDFGCYDRVDGSDDAERTSTGGGGGDGDDANDQETGCRGVLLNGLLVRSPLAAPTGTYTAERATNVEGRPWVHLYRACVPDLPGTSGRRSSAQVYVKALEAAGLDMATNASLFTGLCWPVGRGLQAQMRVVTHQNVGLDPIEFARRTLVALGAAERAVRRRAARAIAAADAVTDAIEHEIDRLRTRILVACESAAASHVPIASSLISSSQSSVSQRRRTETAIRRKREPRDQTGGREDRQSARARRRRRDHKHRDDCVEPVWCVTHERWERASVSCTNRLTTTTTGDLTDTASTASATQSASESATTESNCASVASSCSSLSSSTTSSSSLTPSSPRSSTRSSSFAAGSTLAHASPSRHSPSSTTSTSTSTSNTTSPTSPTSSIMRAGYASAMASQVSDTSLALREPHTASGAGRARESQPISESRASQVAFDITECSEDIYSCCSECCSSSGCSCSVDGSTRDASSSSATGVAD